MIQEEQCSFHLSVLPLTSWRLKGFAHPMYLYLHLEKVFDVVPHVVWEVPQKFNVWGPLKRLSCLGKTKPAVFFVLLSVSQTCFQCMLDSGSSGGFLSQLLFTNLWTTLLGLG